MELNTTVVASTAFSHNPHTKTISAELSTLDDPVLKRLYDDACDIGLTLHNDKTRNRTRWYWVEDKGADGELQARVLRPCSESVRKTPAVAGYTMLLFND